MADTKQKFKIIIVGAGLSGSLLANGLMRHGIEVAVYERLTRDSRREGYQIRLGAPSLVGLRACLSQEDFSQIVRKFGRAAGSKSSAPTIYDDKFRPLIDLARFQAYSKSAPINRVILRDALAEPLYKRGKLHYGKAFARFEVLHADTQDERVRVWFNDGSFDDCDILIGADGSHSQINVQLGLDNIGEVPKYVSIIAKSELPTEKFLKMSASLRAGPVAAFADKIPLYFAVYLPDRADDREATSKDSKGFDDTASSCTFGVHLLSDTLPPNMAQLSREEKWDVVSLSMRGWAQEYHEMIDAVKSADPYVFKARASAQPPMGWRTKDSKAGIPELGHPRIWLMGDAIHAMLPTRGMGGNQAMRDAATALPILVRLASQASSGQHLSTESIKEACKEYEDEMIPRAFSWVRKSGGSNLMPVDSSTLIGRLFFALAGVALQVAALWYKLSALLGGGTHVDDAPELQT